MARNQIGTLIITVKLIAIGLSYYLIFNYVSLFIIDYQLKTDVLSIKNKIIQDQNIPVPLISNDYQLEITKTTEKKFNNRFFNQQHTEDNDTTAHQYRTIESFMVFNHKNYKITVWKSPLVVHYTMFFGTLIILSSSLVVYKIYNRIVKVTRLKFLKLIKETLTSIDASST